ncbi:MAG TPA: energy transducer TonB [Bacteroidia bacterium]|jgi:TonB family protein|nr:energy transducer TonB [Bacteroidia bacterium]
MNSTSIEQKDAKVLPLLISLTFLALVLLALYLIKLHTPLPPFIEDSSGPEVAAYGTMDLGSGEDVNPPSFDKKSSPPPPAPEDESAVTNSTDNSDYVVPPVKKTKEKSVVVKPVDKPVEKHEEPKPDDELTKILKEYNAKSKTVGGGHGDDKTPGFKGDPGGSPESKNYNGKPGPGGNGPNGPGGPGGTGAYLSHRKLVVPAKLISTAQEEGRVVVKITVDKDGNVIDAIAVAKGSTTTNSELWTLARQAARKAKFDRNPDGDYDQEGTYFFDFTLH